MDIDELLSIWQKDPEFIRNTTCWQISQPVEAHYEPFPDNLPERLLHNLKQRGITRLYSHQAQALRKISAGEHVVVSTGTASGKTLCYDIPVIQALLQDSSARALYLFPTKALAQDQLRLLKDLCAGPDGSPRPTPAIYDGDTPAQHRSEIRKNADIIITNPDMLHQGILPHHTIWRHFFTGLKYVVIDEIHTYRGVFGSHVANVVRRLKRVAAFYHSYPQFILTSATIGNPEELAAKLIESPAALIDEDGSPHGRRHFLVYNPPLVNEQLGLRASSLQTGIHFTRKLLANDLQTLVFTRSRRSVEMILAYLYDSVPREMRSRIRGYRSGYLKADRREIEAGFKEGSIKAVVATSALELGIDIGSLESVLLVGYPGSIATTRQRAGRAGRRQQPSLAMFIASPEAMDQYLANHPEYITDKSPEDALLDPNNYAILMQHLQCAAFELPFLENDHFGSLPAELLQAFLQILVQSGVLHLQNGKYFWIADQFAAGSVSLRSSTPNVITLRVGTGESSQVIGEIDAASARWLVHPEAIYLQEAETYEVLSLDLEHGSCLLKPVQSEYYTIPNVSTTIEAFTSRQEKTFSTYASHFGELSLRLEVSSYRKIRWLSAETIGTGLVELPPTFMETSGCWLTFASDFIDQLRDERLWNADPNQYGPIWNALKSRILARDGRRCRVCGTEGDESQLHVHHIKPFKTFEDPELANAPANLITLCPSCHQQAERNVRLRSGLAGAAYALGNLAPLLVMCDREDLGMLAEARSVLANGGPALMVYDNVPGGIGLSERLFERRDFWISKAVEMISECQCKEGCPACVGPIGEEGHGGKQEALALLTGLV
ncbi:MAG: DEAD/DEAH box helicase [Chloroflexi bacterium]|jgi:DEAD/DEAH box helicase domain-containing protein|nr:DEAD/DEAH box helicase [Anaerolineaceae bacterium]NLI44172.1 DEAD/DEAH box helicase [Chloroflexota bacterium]